jgi:hypothetical protein
MRRFSLIDIRFEANGVGVGKVVDGQQDRLTTPREETSSSTTLASCRSG